MIRYIEIFLMFVASTGIVYCQNVQFVASADAEEIIEGGYFNITFTLENARGTSFQPPSFHPFVVEGGPNQSSQMSIINGKTTQKMSFGYTLSISRAGTYQIASASIKVNNKTLKTEPLTISVVKSQNGSNSTGSDATAENQDAFISLEIEGDTAHVGQQITLKYVLYTTLDVRSYNFVQIPDFDGFYAEEISNYNERPVRIVRNGRQYIKRALKVYALFPQQKGRFVIDPAVVNIGVARKGFFDQYMSYLGFRIMPIRLQTAK